MKRILLIGGGGHCRSVIDTLKDKDYDEIGIIDSVNVCYDGISVVGADEDIVRLYKRGWTEAFVTVGSIGDVAARRRLYNMVKETGFAIPAVIDQTAIVSEGTLISEGVFVGKGAIINAGCKIGECAIINTGAIIEHDCRVDSFAHISTGAILCGQTEIGENTHVGAGTVIRQLVKTGRDSLIGAGSVVVKDIPDGVMAYGNPCRVIKNERIYNCGSRS